MTRRAQPPSRWRDLTGSLILHAAPPKGCKSIARCALLYVKLMRAGGRIWSGFRAAVTASSGAIAGRLAANVARRATARNVARERGNKKGKATSPDDACSRGDQPLSAVEQEYHELPRLDDAEFALLEAIERC